MAIISPTVLASSPREFELQMDRIANFAERIQIDLADGEFAAVKTVNPIQAWWPQDITADIHLMFARPHEQIETLVSLRPSMVIIHAEAEGDLAGLIDHLRRYELRVGVALLPGTEPEGIQDLISRVDHALLFSGSLGHFGGKADLELLQKIPAIRRINPTIEIGWDGGANEENVRQLADSGVDVINVGGAIQRSDDPEKAYATLKSKLQK